MDFFGSAQLQELLERHDPPCVSLYLPTHRSGSEADTDRLQFRAALDRARDLLHEDYGDDDLQELFAPVADLAAEREFWRYQSDGLAAFLSPAFARLYRLPAPFDHLVVVGPTFHTRPLVEYLQAPTRFWVLGLSEKKVQLWEGTASGLSPMDLRGMPRDLLDALGYEFEREDELVHKSRGRRGGGMPGVGGGSPVFHGHGVGDDDREPQLRRFFRKVDRGLAELLEEEIGPIVLAAVEEYHPIYRSVSELENLAVEGIHASVAHWTSERLHEAAWPIARGEAGRKVERALELWEAAYKQDKAEPDLANLSRLAAAGRVRLLLTERRRRIWGTMDRRTGEIDRIREGGEDPGHRAVELVDELAEVVFAHGGKALVLSEERMPTETGVAGVLW